MTDTANVQKNELFTLVESVIVAIGTTIELSDIDAVRTHCFAACKFYTEAAGTTQVTPDSGTLNYRIKTVNMGDFEGIVDSPAVLGVATHKTVNWGNNTESVEVVATTVLPSSVTHYKLLVTCNGT